MLLIQAAHRVTFARLTGGLNHQGEFSHTSFPLA
jgi:hypothetical protein